MLILSLESFPSLAGQISGPYCAFLWISPCVCASPQDETVPYILPNVLPGNGDKGQFLSPGSNIVLVDIRLW